MKALTSIFLIFLYISDAGANNPFHQYWDLPVATSETSYPGVSSTLIPYSCGLCHQDQYAQWKASYHARAVGPGLLGQLPLFDEGTARDCLNCHAPRESDQKDILSGRQMSAHGVDCASCHVRSHIWHGPNEKPVTPHGPMKMVPLFKQSRFCATCHQFGEDAILVNGKPLENTYVEWRNSVYAKSGQTCQSCHMESGKHQFKGIHDKNMVTRGLSVTAVRTMSGVQLTLENKGAGHYLPTYITPRVLVIWRGADGHERRLYTVQRNMSWSEATGWTENYDTRLQPKEKRKIAASIGSITPGYIEIWVEPDADYYDRVYPAIIAALIDSHADEEPVKMIESARLSARDTRYRLYRLYCSQEINSVCK